MNFSTATNTALNGVVGEANKERKERNEARKRKLESQQNNTLSCVYEAHFVWPMACVKPKHCLPFIEAWMVKISVIAINEV